MVDEKNKKVLVLGAILLISNSNSSSTGNVITGWSVGETGDGVGCPEEDEVECGVDGAGTRTCTEGANGLAQWSACLYLGYNVEIVSSGCGCVEAKGGTYADI